MASNQGERGVVLDLLGACSVLATADHRGFLDHFVPAAERVIPPGRFVERDYPTCWWRARDGIDRAAARALGLTAAPGARS